MLPRSSSWGAIWDPIWGSQPAVVERGLACVGEGHEACMAALDVLSIDVVLVICALLGSEKTCTVSVPRMAHLGMQVLGAWRHARTSPQIHCSPLTSGRRSTSCMSWQAPLVACSMGLSVSCKRNLLLSTTSKEIAGASSAPAHPTQAEPGPSRSAVLQLLSEG